MYILGVPYQSLHVVIGRAGLATARPTLGYSTGNTA